MADLQLQYGSLYWSSAAATANVTSTPIKCAGTTTEMATNGFSHTDNRLTYTGTATLTFLVQWLGSMSASAATEIKLFLYKNGTLITGSNIIRQVSTANDEGAGGCQAMVSLATNDYI